MLYVSLFLSAKDLNCCLVKCRKSSQAASHGKQCHILLTHKIVLQRPLQGDGTNRDAGQLPIGIFKPTITLFPLTSDTYFYLQNCIALYFAQCRQEQGKDQYNLAQFQNENNTFTITINMVFLNFFLSTEVVMYFKKTFVNPIIIDRSLVYFKMEVVTLSKYTRLIPSFST